MDDVRIRIAIFSGWPGLSTILWGKSKKSLHVKEPAQSTSTRLPSAHRLFYIGRALIKKKKGEEKIVACWYIGRALFGFHRHCLWWKLALRVKRQQRHLCLVRTTWLSSSLSSNVTANIFRESFFWAKGRVLSIGKWTLCPPEVALWQRDLLSEQPENEETPHINIGHILHFTTISQYFEILFTTSYGGTDWSSKLG